MELTPREKDKLLLFTAALVAERRKARGLKLNYPEAVAYISAAIMEGARDGRTVAELMTFGTKLVTVHHPIARCEGDLIAGEVFTEPGNIELNEGRATTTLSVANTGDR